MLVSLIRNIMIIKCQASRGIDWERDELRSILKSHYLRPRQPIDSPRPPPLHHKLEHPMPIRRLEASRIPRGVRACRVGVEYKISPDERIEHCKFQLEV